MELYGQFLQASSPLASQEKKSTHETPFGPRNPAPLKSQDPGELLKLARNAILSGLINVGMDTYDHLILAFSQHSIVLLANLYDTIKMLPSANRYEIYQSRFFDFGIMPNDKVLDVGSGNMPFPLATHLADITLTDDKYGRAGCPFRYLDGKAVHECNIENLPFDDKYFEFVYCSHVLEHVDNPEKACRELIRVGRRGYIETPTGAKDLIFNTAKESNHLWMVDCINGNIMNFHEYTPKQIVGLDCNLVLKMNCSPVNHREKALNALAHLRADRLNTMLLWENEFDFNVYRYDPRTSRHYLSSSSLQSSVSECNQIQMVPSNKGNSDHPVGQIFDTTNENTDEEYYRDNKNYFEYQKSIGIFGGIVNRFKFETFINSDDTVIDFGCGGGYLLSNLKCRRKIGVEPNRYALQTARASLDEVYETAQQVPDNVADVIISNHSLEHASSPLDQLKILKSKLKCGGSIVLVIPHQDLRETYDPNDRNNHLYTWNRQTLGNLFKMAGFGNIRTELIQHQWPPDHVDLFRKHGEERFHRICHEYALKNNNYQIRICAQNTKPIASPTFLTRALVENQTPVVLITYNRPCHTRKVIESLRHHNRKTLYIFADGPKQNRDNERVEATRKIFREIDWTTPTIVERETNIGLAESVVSAVDYVLQSHEQLILLEDDCVPQNLFFDFIEKCLEKYRHHERIFGVSGYTVQIPDKIRQCYQYDLYFTPRIGSWGWGTWKRAWRHFEYNLDSAYQKAMQAGIDLNQGGTDVLTMLNQIAQGQLRDVWTLNWILTVYLNQGSFIYPTISHVKNIGMDGSGVHCGATDKFSSEIACYPATRFPVDIHNDPIIINHFRRYYDHR
jgi:ubiquinone/menaquinone biosynthesis C-methylase UbiE